MTDAFEDAWNIMDPSRGHPAKRYYPDDMESLLDFALDNFRSSKYHVSNERTPHLKPDTKLLFEDWRAKRKQFLEDTGKDNSVFVRYDEFLPEWNTLLDYLTDEGQL